MEHMMMDSMGPIVFGFHLYILLMIVSGVFYLICASIFWKSAKKENNELTYALMAFLVYQSISMFFMGIEMHTMNLAYSNIASLAVFIGSVYMLKFPLSSFSSGVRRVVFNASLILVLFIFAWFMQTEAKQMALMTFTLWYDLFINGIVVGGSILYFGFRNTQYWSRFKAVGGGTGVLACCVVANGAMLGGSMILGSFFSFLAPLIITISILVARNRQKTSA